MKSINEKLLDAYYNNDLSKMEKYLKQGASPSQSEDALFTMAACSGEYDVLKLLIQYDKDKHIIENKQIMGLAALYNHTNCIKLLLGNGVNPNDFVNTTIYDEIKDIKVDIDITGNITHEIDSY